MALALDDFQGSYTIKYGDQSGIFPVKIHKGYRLSIGTGYFNDPQPDGIRIGLSILDEQDNRVLPQDDLPAYAYLHDGTLNGTTHVADPDPGKPPLLVTFQISLLSMRLPDGGLYKAPSIMITIGDPENAGVWGADDTGG